MCRRLFLLIMLTLFPLSHRSHPSTSHSLSLSRGSFLSPRSRARARTPHTHDSPDDSANSTLEPSAPTTTTIPIGTRRDWRMSDHGRTRADQPHSLPPPSPHLSPPSSSPAASAARDRSSDPFGDDRLCSSLRSTRRTPRVLSPQHYPICRAPRPSALALSHSLLIAYDFVDFCRFPSVEETVSRYVYLALAFFANLELSRSD